MMSPETILRLADQCDGWSILCPDHLRDDGLSDDLIAELADCFESNPSEHKASIFDNDGRLLTQVYGIYSLSLLRRLAALVNADLSGVVAMGRGTQAEQFKRAIRQAISKGGESC
jgi:hypothetical protein